MAEPPDLVLRGFRGGPLHLKAHPLRRAETVHKHREIVVNLFGCLGYTLSIGGGVSLDWCRPTFLTHVYRLRQGMMIYDGFV